MDSKIEHLKMLQGVIDRLAGNSFTLKGWTVLILSALFALGASEAEPRFIPIAYIPTVSFWYLDGYYLKQERLFRELYRQTVESDESNFTMDTSEQTVPSLPATMISLTIGGFYGSILTAITIVSLVVALR